MGIIIHPLHIKALTGEINSESENDGYFNGKYDGEKYVLGDGKVFKDFVRLLQESGADRRFVHPERIIGSSPLVRCMNCHLNAPYRTNMITLRALTIIGRPNLQSSKTSLSATGFSFNYFVNYIFFSMGV